MFDKASFLYQETNSAMGIREMNFQIQRTNQNLFQIYLSDQELDLPSSLKSVQQLHQRIFREYDYYLLNIISLRKFIKDTFSSEVLSAYDCLKPYAYKADLGRYCLIYKYGGWYSDITIKPLLVPEVVNEAELIYFYDHGLGSCNALHGCQNGLFFARSEHPLLEDVIQQIVHNCQKNYYGLNPLSPTGPNLFGSKIVNYTPAKKVFYGYFMPLTPSFKLKNRAYIGPKGEVIAWHKSAWCPTAGAGNLIDFGAKGVNNYTRMWLDRDVYQ